MDDRMIESLCRCVDELQGFASVPETMVEPSLTVARLGKMLRQAASTLPFDVDPTGFGQRLEDLAGR